MIRDFLLAVGFFTRIPVPDHPNYSEQAMNNTSYYFPLIGLLVGALNLLVFWLSAQLFSVSIAVVLSLGFSFLLTGGFHEDGWADTFDGLGGAFERSRKLEIMTDSRLGTYGSLALFFILGVKALALIELLSVNVLLVVLVAHGLSRWIAMLTMVFCDYVRVEPNKAKPVAQKISVFKWFLSGLVLVPAFLFVHFAIFGTLIVASLAVCFIWILILKKQLGGYTGDTLGAIQQSVEVAIYLSWLACI
ncbi:adenosylcobinamide-GDP ribazoletransferase [Reinekea sp.]|jgi:adenosylcobinamide-GDP ribazoletransferase|uniref:adenosylcobinamide-GDP ribazoletransferase n=1 Tax=Reinekea sp. TaxID=1970455 RepID=UPI0039894391